MLGNAALIGWYTSSKAKYATRPIANQYREGKLKTTLERELKERETGGVETDGADEYDLL